MAVKSSASYKRNTKEKIHKGSNLKIHFIHFITFEYDANGNTTSKTDSCGTTTYSWDTENRLTGINGFGTQCSPLSAIFKYDPFGRRIEKNVNGAVTKYAYDNEDIIAGYDGNNQLIASYTHGPGIDEPISMTNGQTYYYHTDALGSIIAITNSTGNVVQRYEYDSFGNIVSVFDPNFKQPYTYTGREYDSETGLYYYRARYYDAEVGRFISEDPIGFSGGINLYLYVENDPVNSMDPFGLLTQRQECKLVCQAPSIIPCSVFGYASYIAGGPCAGIAVSLACKSSAHAICSLVCPSDLPRFGGPGGGGGGGSF